MQTRKRLIFISGTRKEFENIRKNIVDVCLKYLGLQVYIFEQDKIPGYIPTMEECEEWGRDCDLMILIAGEQYGSICDKGISFTELEFDAAFRNNKNKIRVFVKDSTQIEIRQQEFISKISDGGASRRYVKFKHDEELLERVPQTIVDSLLNPWVSSELPDVHASVVWESAGFRVDVINNHDEDVFLKDPIIFDGDKFDNMWLGKHHLLPSKRASSKSIKTERRDLKNNWIREDKHLAYETTAEIFFTVSKKLYNAKYKVWNEGDREVSKLIKLEPV